MEDTPAFEEDPVELIDTDTLAQDMERWYRDHWQPLERDLVQAATELGRALSIDLTGRRAEFLAGFLGPDLHQYQVAMTLPRMDLRQVLTQGLVPYTPTEPSR